MSKTVYEDGEMCHRDEERSVKGLLVFSRMTFSLKSDFFGVKLTG